MAKGEYIAALKLETDGDWHIDSPAKDMYYDMAYDGAYDKRVRVFDTATAAAAFLAELAQSLSEGLGRWRELGKYDRLYPDSLAALSVLLRHPEITGELPKVQRELESDADVEGGVADAGGFSFSYDTGNWSWSAGLYFRFDGIVGETQWVWVDPDILEDLA